VINFVVRRLFAAMVLLIVVSMVTFAIFFYIPRLIGQTPEQMALQFMGKSAQGPAIAATVHQFGFDKPVPVQYWRFLHNLVAGTNFNTGTGFVHCPAPCLGVSYQYQVPVFPEIQRAFPVTLSLAIGASIIWLVMGVAVGVLSALRKGSLYDRAAMGIALAGVSLPIFFTAPLVLLLLVYQWQVFPHPVYNSFLHNPFTWAQGLFLPWVVLAFQFAALYARLTRAGMLDTMGEDFIRTARAKGLPERRVVVKHGLRAVMTPVVTIFGMDFGLLMGGAILTETSFGLNGLGKLAFDGISYNDLPVILGVTLVAAVFVILSNLVVDIVYGVVDPRVRTK
jgi:peptide/nickel transport system permease protein